jgi:energy-coupling factor transporter transmembrane protein EcfT
MSIRTKQADAGEARPPRETELTFLRLVPGDSLVHRLWAGTKLVVAFELALVVSIIPSWAALAIVGATVVLGLLIAHIPLGALPRLPNWFFIAIAIGGATSVLGNADPVVHIGGFPISLGGLSDWARLILLGVILVLSGALVGWTTPLGEIAPAFSRLTTPLRWLRLPVDEWVVAVAVAIRCLPILIDEIRTLMASRRLRRSEETEPETFRELLRETHDLLSTAVVVSIRRARDLSDAMMARGGLGGAVADSTQRLGVRDIVVLVAVTALSVGTVVVLAF